MVAICILLKRALSEMGTTKVDEQSEKAGRQ